MLLIHNARLHTMDAACPAAEAAVVEGGAFAYVGTLAGARLFVGRAAHDSLDAGGHSVIPGLNDSHLHLQHTAMRGENVALDGAASIDEICLRMRHGMDARAGEWLIGEGWNQEGFAERRLLTRADLDTVSADIPMFAVRACGHIATANSAAMATIGALRPDGIFREDELALLWARVPAPTVGRLLEGLLAAQHGLLARGITSVQSDDLGSVPYADRAAYLKALRAASLDGRLRLRYAEQALMDGPRELMDFYRDRLHTLRGGHFHIACVKLLADGSLGARTAWLRAPYADDAATRGIPIFPGSRLAAMVDAATAGGMPVAVHVIGDAAMQQALDAIDAYGRGLRNALVHAQISDAEQAVRCGRMGLVVHAQPVFLRADTPLVRARVGDALAQTSYRWRMMRAAGAHVALGTDCPVEPFDPWPNLYCAITRRGAPGMDAYLPEEGFTLEEALFAYTAGGAYASGEEGFKGRICPGMAADFVCVDRRLDEREPEMLLETKATATFIAGEAVYRQ